MGCPHKKINKKLQKASRWDIVVGIPVNENKISE